jgi:hypothetical protein
MDCKQPTEANGGWQPIETAPTAVTLLLFVDPYILTGVRFRKAWMNRGEHIAPTHWMPLPAAPTEPKGGSRNLNEERKVFARMIAGQSDAFNEYNMGKLKVIDYE